jgi:hypothetical protein
MRRLTLVFPLALLLPAAEIPQGTHVLLRMVNAVSTRTAREGDHVYLRTASPILVDGQFVVPAEGGAIGGLADRSWKGAGIGAGVGTAIGLATTLLTRGKEVELLPGSTFDVVFDRPVTID